MMPLVRKEGKDTIIFATKEDHSTPSKIELPEPEPSPGLILSNGEINWNCPCLGGMATGPCGLEFREAFSCFHYSTADPKGSDCYEAFHTMQSCMAQYPSLYGSKTTNMSEIDDDLDEMDDTKSEPKSGNKDTSSKQTSDEKPVDSSSKTEANASGN